MTLTLTMLRCPDAVAPETRVLTGGEFSIGRGSENDWVLPDPERFLSKRHCMLAYRAGSWQVADLSTNGTFLNGEAESIGHVGGDAVFEPALLVGLGCAAPVTGCREGRRHGEGAIGGEGEGAD